MWKCSLKISRMSAEEMIFRTWSLCPVCLKRIKAERVRVNGRVFIRKECPEHGHSESIIWRGFNDFDEWINGSDPLMNEEPACTDNCGLCSGHLQKTCCVLLNVTNRCDLDCLFCLAGNYKDRVEPELSEIKESLTKLIVKGKTLVQLSGGEPATRDDLPEIIRAAKNAGAKYVQLNTNGIRLGEDRTFTAELALAGLSFVFMQFDGTDDSVYERLRGRPLFDIKRKAIDNCAEYNIGVTLVPTLVREININETGKLIRFAISESPKVRGVHFQPVSFFGRIPGKPDDNDRITLDELIFEIERQTEGLIKFTDLVPSCCDHPLCGFHGDFLVDNEEVIPLLNRDNRKKNSRPAEDAAEKNREFVAKRWKRPAREQQETGNCCGNIHDMEYFLKKVSTNGLTISAMAFQDAWNLDLARLKKCSLHVYEKGNFIPFCAYYLSGWEK